MDPVAPGLYSASAVINEMQGTTGVLPSALVSHSSGRERNLPDLGFFFFCRGSRGRVCHLKQGLPV